MDDDSKKRYKHLFFDLDYTLWDFKSNSLDTLKELYVNFNLKSAGIPEESIFIERYHFRNDILWDAYRKQEIDRDFLRVNRWIRTLNDFQISDKVLAYQLSDAYLKQCALKSKLLPGAFEALAYLRGKYALHIITNGFDYVQTKKLKHCGLDRFFQVVITSEEAGCMKPDRRVFDYALLQTDASADASIYIGDNWDVDIIGAKNAGLDQVYYNPYRIEHASIRPTFEIRNLKELINIF